MLLAVLGAILAIDGWWVWVNASSRPLDTSLQRATGGIGLTASASPAWSFFSLDPRIERHCENELWPIPGATCFSPHHGAGVADVPPLDAFVNEGHVPTMPRTRAAE